ncbi:MAG: Smr/MutS family protein, partial [Bacteroidota bacterium]
EFDTEHLKPTYKFNQGLPGSSYAFEVAGRIGFDNSFISLSKEFLDTDKTKIEDFLISLEKKSKHLKEQLNVLERENTRLKGLTNLYHEKIEKLENQKKEILAQTKEKAEIFLSDVNKRIESAIKNIRESQADKEVIKKEKKKIEEIKKESAIIFKKERKINPPNMPIRQAGVEEKVELKIGDYASIQDTASVGVLSEIDKEKNRAVLGIGSLKIKTKYSDLVPAKKSQQESTDRKQFRVDQTEISYRLDIRGKRADEAEFEVIKFLDNANASGADRVEILHGKGTGALKQLVHGILRTNHSVKNYYFANIEYGGEGITIVEFK